MKRQDNMTGRPGLAAVMVLAMTGMFVLAGCEEGDLQGDEASGIDGLSQDAQLENSAVADCPRGKRMRDGRGRGDRMHEKGRHGGAMDGMIRAAIEDLDLSPEQKATLEGLREEPREGKRAWKKDGEGRGRGEFHQAFIDALKTGKVDRGAFELPAEAFVEADGFLARRAERLNTLHATLTPEQRVALVAAVSTRFEGKGEFDKGRRGDRFGKKGKRSGERGDRMGKKGHSMLSRLEKDLDLTEEQVEQMNSLRQKLEADRPARGQKGERRAAMMDHKKAMLEAFVGDTFDAASFEPKDRPGFDKDAFADNKVEMLEGIIEILTPEQRAALADKLQEKGRRFEARK